MLTSQASRRQDERITSQSEEVQYSNSGEEAEMAAVWVSE
jgi:hypothetical protein